MDAYILDEHNRATMCSFDELMAWRRKCDEDAVADGPDTEPRWRVAFDEVGGWRVSTVFLGLDHSWNSADPLIFETMIFPPDSYRDYYCERYTTWEQAEIGHKRAIQWAESKGEYDPKKDSNKKEEESWKD